MMSLKVSNMISRRHSHEVDRVTLVCIINIPVSHKIYISYIFIEYVEAVESIICEISIESLRDCVVNHLLLIHV